MKIPRQIRTYCPRCRKHTVHSVTIYKHGKRRTLAQGQRRYLRKQEGYGSKRGSRSRRGSLRSRRKLS